MNIIEKIKAGHPCEEVDFKGPYVTENGKVIRSFVVLLPEPKPCEILTEEWVKYFARIETPMQFLMSDGSWTSAQIHFGGSFSTLQYRLPLPKKLRNKRPDELPYAFVITKSSSGLMRIPRCNLEISATEIGKIVDEGGRYSSNGETSHSFQTEDII